jgi:hypothetical protein
MKPHQSRSIILAACALAVPTAAAAGEADTNSLNRFSFDARAGFNISARFKSLGSFRLQPNARTTPNSSPYNYDNGYVYKDVSGSVDGQTWNWGYDNSASQISGNNILMSRSTVASSVSSGGSGGVDGDDANYGGEFVYNREIGKQGNLHYGIEVAANYMNVALNDNSPIFGNAARVTDAYPFTPGTTPPLAPPAYQGSFGGPGFVIGSTPVSSTTTGIPGGATIVGHRQFNADIWGLRLGPYLEFPISQRLNLSLSGGLAVALVDGSASWHETAYISGGGTGGSIGSGHDLNLLFGGYLSAKLAWQLSQRWNVEGGVQYQNLGRYEHSLGGRAVELDLSRSMFVTFGAGYKF